MSSTSPSPHIPPSDKDISDRHLLRRITLKALRFGLPVMAGIYGLVSVLHLLRFDPPEAWALFALALASSACLYAGYRWVLQIEEPSGQVERIADAGLVLLLTNTLSVIFLSENLHFSVNIPLLLLGSGFLHYSLPRLVAFHLLTLLSWLGVILSLPEPEKLDYLAVPLGIALLLSYVVRRIIWENVLELEKSRRLDVARRLDLEHALLALSVEREKRLEKTQEAEFARQIIATVSNLIIVIDSSGSVLYASSSIERLLGFTPESVMGSGWFRMTRTDRRTALKERQELLDLAARAEGSLRLERLIQDARGNMRWILWQGTPMDDDRWIGVGTDITEQKKLQEQRDHLNEELSEALTTVKTLEGLLPICAHCKKIRDDGGNWNRIEEFLADHSDAVFSHGICPDCYQTHYAESPA